MAQSVNRSYDPLSANTADHAAQSITPRTGTCDADSFPNHRKNTPSTAIAYGTRAVAAIPECNAPMDEIIITSAINRAVTGPKICVKIVVATELLAGTEAIAVGPIA